MGNMNYCEQKEDENNQIRTFNPCELINIEDDDFLICDYSKISYDSLIYLKNPKKLQKKTENIKFNSYKEKNNKNNYRHNMITKNKNDKNKLIIRNKSLPQFHINQLALIYKDSNDYSKMSKMKASQSCENIIQFNEAKILKIIQFNKLKKKKTVINKINNKQKQIIKNSLNKKKLLKIKPKPNNDILRRNSAMKIQHKFRCFRNRKLYQNILRARLIKESEDYINYLINKYTQNMIEPKEKYSLTRYQQFYQKNDPFFKYNYGKVFNNQIRIAQISQDEYSIYQGEMNINNEKHGFGKLITKKYILIGTWRNNNFTGWNRESNYNGNYIEGKFINGFVNGKGILGNKKGNKYIGDFVNSIRNGKGELINEKFYYKGNFSNNYIEGYGVMKFLLDGHEYKGEFKKNQIEGKGTFKWKNGDKYEGEMRNGKIHGKGKYYYANGDIFDGYFIGGVKQEKGGEMIYANNS